MRGKLAFIAGLAAGYVLGARAGRERYEELVHAARKVRDNPTLQEAAGLVQAQATRLAQSGKEVVANKLGSTRIGERLFGHTEPYAAAQSDTGGRPNGGQVT